MWYREGTAVELLAASEVDHRYKATSAQIQWFSKTHYVKSTGTKSSFLIFVSPTASRFLNSREDYSIFMLVNHAPQREDLPSILPSVWFLAAPRLGRQLSFCRDSMHPLTSSEMVSPYYYLNTHKVLCEEESQEFVHTSQLDILGGQIDSYKQVHNSWTWRKNAIIMDGMVRNESVKNEIFPIKSRQARVGGCKI